MLETGQGFLNTARQENSYSKSSQSELDKNSRAIIKAIDNIVSHIDGFQGETCTSVVKSKPILMVENQGWSDNRGVSGGTLWLKISNQGLDDVQGMGILEQIELANPGKDQSMTSYPQSCPLIWGGSNPIPGKCSSTLDIIYREPRTLSNYHYGLAYTNYDKKNIGLPTGMEILIIIAMKSKDAIPLFTVRYFLGKDSIAFDKFKVLNSNLRQRPSIADCREMLIQRKRNSGINEFLECPYY